jgi:hypothetical protein
VSGNNHCRAHSSESEDLGSVSKSEVIYKLPVFQGGGSRVEMRGIPRFEILVWLRGVTMLLFGRIAKTDLGTEGTQGLSLYTGETC